MQEESWQGEHIENCSNLVDPTTPKICLLVPPLAAAHFQLNLLLEYAYGVRSR